jgi:polyisoprenoid-binding protein YceI
MEATAASTKTQWSIDQVHSEISFKVRHLMIAHARGSFKIFDANIFTEGKDFETAEIEVWIDAASIHTGDATRDEHLRSAEFFDVKNHLQITFNSSTICAPDKVGNRVIWGELAIKGIKKNVELWVTFGGISMDPWGNEKAGFSINGTIQRSDWGLVWNTPLGDGGLMVGDDVQIHCEVELVNVTGKDRVMDLKPGQRNKGI